MGLICELYLAGYYHLLVFVQKRKISPKTEVFGRTSLRTSGQKLRSGTPNPGKTSILARACRADVHEKTSVWKTSGWSFVPYLCASHWQLCGVPLKEEGWRVCSLSRLSQWTLQWTLKSFVDLENALFLRFHHKVSLKGRPKGHVFRSRFGGNIFQIARSDFGKENGLIIWTHSLNVEKWVWPPGRQNHMLFGCCWYGKECDRRTSWHNAPWVEGPPGALT